MTFLTQLVRVSARRSTASLHSSAFLAQKKAHPTKADLANAESRTASEAAVKADAVTQSPEELQKEATRLANEKNKSGGNSKIDQEVKDQIEGRKAARGVEG